MQPKILQTCKKITEALSRAGLSRVDFARLAGITEASVSRYLSGKSEPRSAELARIALVLNVTTDWFLGLTEDPAPPLPSLSQASPVMRETSPPYGLERGSAGLCPRCQDIDDELKTIGLQIDLLRMKLQPTQDHDKRR